MIINLNHNDNKIFFKGEASDYFDLKLTQNKFNRMVLNINFHTIVPYGWTHVTKTE